MFDFGFLPKGITLKKLIWLKASGIVGAAYQTFTGTIARFLSPSSKPVKSIVCNIEPVQSGSGDPSPDNVRPISGFTGLKVYGTGKNLLDVSNATHSNYNIGNIPNILRPNTQYTYSINGDTTNGYRLYLAKSSSPLTAAVILSATYNTGGMSDAFTTPADMSEYDMLCLAGNSSSAGGEDLSNILPQIELGSTATSYEAFSGTTLPVSWQSEAGTVYAGYLSIDKDGNTTVTGTHAKKTFDNSLGYSTWGVNANKDGITGFYYYPQTIDTSIFSMCDILPIESRAWGGAYVGVWNNISPSSSYYIFSFPNEALGISNGDDNATAISKFKAFLANTPINVIEELATPLTYTLSSVTVPSTVQGENNWWHDANGNITIEAIGTPISDEPDALQSLNILLGGAYTPRANFSEPTDEQALNIILGR